MDFLEHGGYSSFPIRREWQSRFGRGRSSRCRSEPNPNGILRYKFLDKGIPLGHSPFLSAFSSIMESLHVSSLAVELLNLVRRTLSLISAPQPLRRKSIPIGYVPSRPMGPSPPQPSLERVQGDPYHSKGRLPVERVDPICRLAAMP